MAVTRHPRFFITHVLFLAAVLAYSAAATEDPSTGNWPSFRGSNATGIAEGYSLPAVWDAASSKNIKWKTPIQGLGLSSPIVWGNRIFLSAAIGGAQNAGLKTGLYGDIRSVQDDSTHRWLVYCLDRQSGRIVWEKEVYTGIPKVKRHPKSTHANSTLATDGRHVVVFFGSEGLYCLDMDGKVLWKRDLGVLDSAFFVAPEAQWEFGSSPIIYQNIVLIQCDVLKGSFVAALDVRDGKEIWRTARNDVPTWGTPTIYADGTNAQVIINGYKHIGSYDVRTGKEMWWLQGGGDIPVPTPVVSRGMAFITNAHGKTAPIYGIRLSAAGDISLKEGETSNQFVAWSAPRDGSYMATPLVYGDYLYNCRWNGVLGCYEADSGKRVYQERLGSGTSAFTASPVAGDGKIYFSSEEGDIYVIKAGPTFEVLARNSMGEVCMASPAISEGTIYFRTQSQLVAVSGK
ncbi:MAG TPA: PQQ-binding-like beta-propeller repeat protein [Acidobacteriota bacterium]|nr:PQQ-binding-like beta-propeller repeat protein [Acidobacteriota bacterium]